MGIKKRGGIVYSTNPDFKREDDSAGREPALPPERQLLYVWLDSKARKGKTVTLIRGFAGDREDLEALAAALKRSCSTGGSVKDGEIIIQGNFREKILVFLGTMGYKTRKAGG